MQPPCPLTLSLPSDPAVLPVVRAFIEAVCQTRGVGDDERHALVVATNEAASNVIRHAHQYARDKTFHVQCTCTDEAVEVALIDEGRPFDIDAVPRLDPGELRIGGRGVFLMRALVDKIECSQRASGGNVLRMVKHHSCPSPPRSTPERQDTAGRDNP